MVTPKAVFVCLISTGNIIFSKVIVSILCITGITIVPPPVTTFGFPSPTITAALSEGTFFHVLSIATRTIINPIIISPTVPNIEPKITSPIDIPPVYFNFIVYLSVV
ncbi:hypothetical protein SDC9_194555 [bioreactor metagenome]|uniref:Uncharacterized protein n=1 Tax=bioreactor metagenome TaxID=1076179 RepID=A0A645I7S7_9ZZZZ